jgi:hypothetical protein
LTVCISTVCVILSFYSAFISVPDATAFAEFDIASRTLSCPDPHKPQPELAQFVHLASRMSEVETRQLPEMFSDYTVRLIVPPKDHEDSGGGVTIRLESIRGSH